jgi:leucyl aminopeptidase
MLDIAFAKPALPKAGALVLLVAEGEAPSGVWQLADEATGGAIARALEVAKFTGAKGKTVAILAPGAGLTRVLVLGLGKPDAVTALSAEEAGGAAAAALGGEPAIAIAAGGLNAAMGAHVGMGATLRAYRFDRYRTKEKPEDKPKLAKATIMLSDPATAKAAYAPLRAVAEGVFISRDLVSEPANILHPVEFAERIRKLSSLGLKISVLGVKEMTKLGFGCLLGVGMGSAVESRMVVMEWHGASGGAARGGKKAAAKKPIAFVGKGVTFDTGGISIKPAGGMEDMKWDMAGAGAVVGLMAALAGRKAKVDAVGLVGLVENMLSGVAQRPGDVVKSYSGQTVEVINTDAEGRLVLADVLWYCQEKFDPQFMVDLATLTGAIIVSLGHEYAGLFSNDDALAGKLAAAGTETGEKLWRMPMGEAYEKLIKSDIADMKNIGGRPGGSISAAEFIKRFVNGKPWAHLDIAGMAWSGKDTACVPKGATAFGVRLLDRFVAEHYEG